MREPEDIGGKVLQFLQRHAQTGGAERKLSGLWAAEITIDLDDTGLVDDMLPRQGKSMIYGESNSGKTFVALDIACRIAAGMPWHGLPVEQGSVVYVAAEAPESVKRRLMGWQIYHQPPALPLYLVTSVVDLMSDDAEALVSLIEDVLSGDRPKLLVIDTMAASMRGDENSGEDMTVYFGNVDRIREHFACHVLVVHHCGKDKDRGSRGWSGIKGTVDVELLCEQGRLTATKIRDGQKGTVYGHELVDVDLGTSTKGRTIKTAVAVPTDQPPPPPPKPEALIPRHKTMLDCLGTAIADHGETLPRAHDIPPGTRGVALERWFEASLRYLPDRKADGSPKPGFSRRQDFMRSVESLQAKGLVKHVDGWCWPG